MSSELNHRAKVRNGVFIYKRPKLVKTLIDGLEGRDIIVTIEEEIRGKSTSQLGYYFGGIIRKSCMKTEVFAGWEFDEIDNLFRREYLSYKKEIIHSTSEGINYSVVKNVTEKLESLDVKEMSLFIEKVLMYCARLGIVILDASEYKLRKYSRKSKLTINNPSGK